MEKGFWLIALDDLSATASYINHSNGQYRVAQVGCPQDWLATNPDTIINAVDASLSTTASEAGVLEVDEPSTAAFILPPFWIGPDGKISPNYLKLVESVCKDLKLKPLGFIANDEAVTEAANTADSFPASFIFVYLNRQLLTLSLVYLGKVKSRLNRVVSGNFDPSIIESTLIDLQSESTLPPQIILAGQIDETIIQQIKNYSWIGKKNVETFLHFPSVTVYSSDQLTNIYCQVISHQFSPNVSITPAPISQVDDIEVDDLEVEPEDELVEEVKIAEVTPSEIGFAPTEFVENSQPLVSEEFDVVKEITPLPPPKIKKSFKLPKITLPQIPKINFRLNLVVWLIPLIFISFLATVFFLSKVKITLLLTPYEFSKTADVDLNSVASKKSFDINSNASVKSTGQKTVGSQAKGEIIIFNKLDKTQTIPKSIILQSDNNLKFELSSSVQLAPSSINYDSGTITMGQTKTLATAIEIGPEYNLPKDAKLTFKDSAYSSLIAKANQVFTGGTKRQASAVSADDKVSLEQKIKADVTSSIDSRLNQDVKTISDAISETIEIKRNRIEYNREVGEEAEEVSASSSNTVSVYYFTNDQKSKIIDSVLSAVPNFSNSKIDPASFKLVYTPSSTDKSKGKLTITGSGIPKINSQLLQKNLSGKTQKSAQSIIHKIAPRTYNYKVNTNMPYFDFFNPLPFLSKNITIESK
ncbi:hypothetical protein KBC75_02975 [Candidatus Shapirobacteria bacterium]|nr:hypothetical protein [Candidatus Shapirobacteria bacterium]